MAEKDDRKESRRLHTESIEERIGQAIIDGILRPAQARVAAAPGGPNLDYTQGDGNYNQTGGGNHNQGLGNYTQALSGILLEDLGREILEIVKVIRE
jgi:hypothetical protein